VRCGDGENAAYVPRAEQCRLPLSSLFIGVQAVSEGWVQCGLSIREYEVLCGAALGRRWRATH
jgi:hypothetical protein